jgi:cytochrome c oxidase assembly protein subunit 17
MAAPPSAIREGENLSNLQQQSQGTTCDRFIPGDVRPPVDVNGNPLRPCCACPETRRVRDDCVLLRGEENCTEYIAAHAACLRSYGFIIQ